MGPFIYNIFKNYFESVLEVDSFTDVVCEAIFGATSLLDWIDVKHGLADDCCPTSPDIALSEKNTSDEIINAFMCYPLNGLNFLVRVIAVSMPRDVVEVLSI